jgi:hypothetical protein
MSGVGAAVLVGGLVLANYGAGVTPAGAQQGVAPDSGVTAGWDSALPAAKRFIILSAFNHEAVLDKNTGLVWEQTPNASTRIWFLSAAYCVNKPVGGTRGWRLPSVAELASLIDPSLPTPFVPASVFTGVQSDKYWSATTKAQTDAETIDPPNVAWAVDFITGAANNGFGKGNTFLAWCVRGGMNADAY